MFLLVLLVLAVILWGALVTACVMDLLGLPVGAAVGVSAALAATLVSVGVVTALAVEFAMRG